MKNNSSLFMGKTWTPLYAKISKTQTSLYKGGIPTMKFVILKNLGMSKISSKFMAQLHCNRWPDIADCLMFLRHFSNLTGKHLRNIKKSAIYDHLLQCNCAINFDGFSILAMDSNMFKLLLRESLLIKWTNLF